MASDQDPRLAVIAATLKANGVETTKDWNFWTDAGRMILAGKILAALDTPRPMEEAPDDGRDFIVVMDDGTFEIGFRHPGKLPALDRAMCVYLDDATGWIPLPRVKEAGDV